MVDDDNAAAISVYERGAAGKSGVVPAALVQS
jgi:hypothetical protein